MLQERETAPHRRLRGTSGTLKHDRALGAMTDPTTPEDASAEESLAALTVLDFFTHLVGDDDAAAARERHSETISTALENVASWLAFDAWLGAGDMEDAHTGDLAEQEPGRRRSFVAVGLVAQISSELVSGALLLFRSGNEYAASALVRQLIECEYLLKAFAINFAEAARWLDANDSERWDFKPSKLRKIGGFDHKEYASHCEAGGHPHPSGRHLLELPRLISGVVQSASGETRDLDSVRALWLDFTFHCDRTWRALTDLLSAEHARFERVERTSTSVEEVAESRREWQQSDMLGLQAGPILKALYADPTTRLTDLVSTEE